MTRSRIAAAWTAAAVGAAGVILIGLGAVSLMLQHAGPSARVIAAGSLVLAAVWAGATAVLVLRLDRPEPLPVWDPAEAYRAIAEYAETFRAAEAGIAEARQPSVSRDVDAVRVGACHVDSGGAGQHHAPETASVTRGASS